MSNKQMQKRVASMREALFKQGYLDEQFSMLEELEDTENPNFCEEIVTIAKNPINFEKLEDLMHHFKGCCCRPRDKLDPPRPRIVPSKKAWLIGEVNAWQRLQGFETGCRC
ncbi:hypothetical protein C5167_044303 [Papaver somniferum]|uniref:Histidine-containing phosphotransfer protein n=1 Tax=Papaver somniferum TaxID=3469 RepID=A0A4Y7LBQ7_PAPSO|nr:hypothetical protein C5167_044303 [Papaver somniferum]